MVKYDIANRIANEIGITQETALEVIQRTLDYIIEGLSQSQRIEFREFGSFQVHIRKSRRVFDFQKSCEFIAPPRVIIKFRPGKNMRKMLATFRVEDVPPTRKRAPNKKKNIETLNNENNI